MFLVALTPRCLQVLADKTTEDYIDIIGYHWYLNFLTPSSILDSVHEDYPNKPIISSEACNGEPVVSFRKPRFVSSFVFPLLCVTEVLFLFR